MSNIGHANRGIRVSAFDLPNCLAWCDRRANFRAMFEVNMIRAKRAAATASLLAATVSVASQPECQAQNSGSVPQSEAPILPGSTNGVPPLQGATMGTIGPPSADSTVSPDMCATPPQEEGAPVISSVMTAGTVKISPQSILDLPIYVLAVPAVAFILYLVVRRNRASIWEMGLVSALILGFTGVLFGVAFAHSNFSWMLNP
jgi:hypothetical protein